EWCRPDLNEPDHAVTLSRGTPSTVGRGAEVSRRNISLQSHKRSSLPGDPGKQQVRPRSVPAALALSPVVLYRTFAKLLYGSRRADDASEHALVQDGNAAMLIFSGHATGAA